MVNRTSNINLYKWDKTDSKQTTIIEMAANMDVIDSSLAESATDTYNIYALGNVDLSTNCSIVGCNSKYAYAPYRLRNASVNCKIRNCYAEDCLRFGMVSGHNNFPDAGGTNAFPGTINSEVTHNSCNRLEEIFLKVEYDCKNTIISDNDIKNVGTERGEADSGGIICFYGDATIEYNRIYSDNTSYQGYNVNSGIYFYANGTGNSTVYKNKVFGLSADGIMCVDNNNDNTIENNEVYSCVMGIKGSLNSSGTTNNRIINNNVHDCSSDGIHVRYNKNSVVNSNRITNCGGYGINAEALQFSDVSFNHVSNIGNRGIHIGGTAKSIKINNNFFNVCNTSASDTNKRVIAVSDGATNLNISNNTITSPSSTHGIYIGIANQVICDKNNVIDTAFFINASATKLSNGKNFVQAVEV
jgi:hypothetical protein